MSGANCMIAIEDLEFHYPQSDFHLRVPKLLVEKGSKVALIGPSGSGKTTLLNLVAGIAVPLAGQVVTGGVRVTSLGDAARRFELPEEILGELLRGIESDLAGATIETWDDLRRYCYRVASTVGLLVVRVRGSRHPQTGEYAENLGIAVQLTNVLRDVGEDAAGGRIYLPREDLVRLGVSAEDLMARRATDEIRLLLALTAERARVHYERAEALLPSEERHLLRPAEAMGRIYRTLLEELHARRFPCLGSALRLSRPRRLAIAAGAWLGLPS